MMISIGEGYICSLYEDYGGMLKNFLVHRYGSEEFANEVAQETFCLACEKKSELLEHPCPKGWLYKTAEYKAMELRRKRFKIESHEVEENDKLSAYCEKLSEVEIRCILQTVLSDAEYQMLLMRYEMKCNYKELSAYFGISEDACKKRVYRSLYRVRRYMEMK